MPRYSLLFHLLFIILLLAVFSLPLFYPSSVLPDTNDTLLISYIIRQVQINLAHLSRGLYYATFFAPYPDTLLYSDLFLASSLITLPFAWLNLSPLITFNFLTLFSLAVTAYAAYRLLLLLTSDHLSSLAGSLLYAFSGFHLAHLPHLQSFNLAFLTLAVYFALLFFTALKIRYLFLFLSIFTLQLSDTFFQAYLLLFIVFILSLFYRPRRFLQPRFLFLALPFLLISFLLAFPYLNFHLSFPEAVRPIRDAAHNSHSLESLFAAYHGYTLLLFSLPALLLPRPSLRRLLPWIAVAAFCFVMSLGPVLKIDGQTLKIFGLPLPLPYALFYYFFPGFTGFRTPTRFLMGVNLALAVLAAFGLTRFSPRFRLLLLPLLLAGLIFEGRATVSYYPIDITPPPVYRQVASLPPGAVLLELPIKLWNMENNNLESYRSLYSLNHQRRRLNGYSGFAPLPWIDLVHLLNNQGVSPATIPVLKNLGVTHILTDQLIAIP